ncbi:MAG: protein kinase [Verrucomicrobia bacterium]|nr:protein kinase [Verrucomicrobiota bacterium]
MAQEPSEMTQPASPNCPQCGNPIPDNAPSGLCPACVLGRAATTANQTQPNPKSPPPSLEELAPHFSDLKILEMIGFGGMGVVYKARQPKLERLVALKILHVQDDDPSFEERFHREARVLARLDHPNIVTIFDFGTAGPYHFLVMELIDGVNLRQAMQSGRFTPDEALTLVQEMCAALKSAHEDGILHRDIKPENILLDSQGRLKIADFGIAKIIGSDEAANFTLTRQDSILGSPQYMAPEQIESPEDVDQRADIYSLGVVFYELLTGELPLGRFAAPSAKNEVDTRIDDIVLRTLEKEREARFQTAADVSTKVASLSKAPPLPSADRSKGAPARFATLSAILTAISLPLVYIIFFTFSSLSEPLAPETPNQLAEEISRNLWKPILGIGAAILSVTTAIIGFVFGLSSLREIRQSEGQKSGLSRATFATVTWPILIFLAIVASSVGASIPTSFPILALLLAVSFGLMYWALIPPLLHWARHQESPGPRFSRLTIILASYFTVLVTISMIQTTVTITASNTLSSSSHIFPFYGEHSRVQIKVKDFNLTVNGKNYGQVEDGDQISVRRGNVFRNSVLIIPDIPGYEKWVPDFPAPSTNPDEERATPPQE